MRILLLSACLWAQMSIRDSVIWLFNTGVGYGGYFPLGDLGARFGYLSQVQGEIAYKNKKNLYFLLRGGALWAEKVREDVVGKFILPSLQRGGTLGMLDENGNIFYPRLEGRGFQIGARVGYLLPIIKILRPNPNSGFFVEVGGEFLRHRLLIDVAKSTLAPYLKGEYLKGYDRLTQGWGIGASMGYRFWGNVPWLNFYVAVEYIHTYARSLRGYNYDLRQAENFLRRDAAIGFRAGWCLPLFPRASSELYEP
ncbi:MAG: hypothetical protein ACUVRD_07585 [Bacteroidia bacterium]